MRNEIDEAVSNLNESIGSLVESLESAIRADSSVDASPSITKEDKPRSEICGHLFVICTRLREMRTKVDGLKDRLDLP